MPPLVPSLALSIWLLCVLGASYLLGSVPFGLILTRLAGLGDIRKIGSGNIGATNVLRTGNKALALLTLFLDGGKGAFAVLIAAKYYPDLAPLAGLAALVGHIFPVWLNFKGGKGVATAVGVITIIAWPVGVTVMVTWLIIAYLSRYSSLAAVVSIGLAPVDFLLSGRGDYMWFAVSIVMLVGTKHIPNIARLRNGTEPKINIGKSKK